MLRKIIVMMLGLAIATGASCQVRTSRTFIKKKKIEWILRGGLSVNNMAGLEGKLKCAFGPELDFGFNKPFGRSQLYWGMELGIGSRGCNDNTFEKWDYAHILYMYPNNNVRAFNAKLTPFVIGYWLKLPHDFRIDPHFGPYVSCDFAYISDFQGKGYYELNQRFDAGIQIGAGVWYKRVNLDFMYQRGFVKTGVNGVRYKYPANDYGKGTTSNFIMRLGVCF